MAGIDSLVSNRADMFAGNPQGLQQRYAMSQDLLDLLALQKLKKDKEAAQRDLQMQMQAPAATVKDQLAGQVMDMTKQEVASSLAPGIQQQGQAMQAQQLQQAMGGIASQPAPNMVGMARGGIVGFQPGGEVEGVPYSVDALRKFDERRRMERELRAAGLAEEEIAAALRDAEAVDSDPASGQNVLGSAMSVRNMPSEAPAGIASVLSEGNPAQSVPFSVDALRRADARRTAPPADEEGILDYLSRIPEAIRRDYDSSTTKQVIEGVPEYLSRIPEAIRRDYDSSTTKQVAEGASDGLMSLVQRVFAPQSPEAQARSKALFAGAPQTAGEMSEPTARLPQVPSLYEMLGGDPDVMARSDERRAYDASLDSVSPTPATQAPGQPTTQLPPLPPNIGAGGTAPSRPTRGIPRTGIASGMSAEEAAMQAMDDRARATQPEAPQDPRLSRSEQRLEELKTEQTDKLGALIEFLLAAGASGGTNLGATLTGGGSGLMARDARLEDEIAKTIQNIETLELRQSEMAQRGKQFDATLKQRIAEELESRYQFDTEYEQKERDLQSRIAAAQSKGGMDLKDMNTLMTTAVELFPPTPELLLDIANRDRRAARQEALSMEELQANAATLMSAQRKYARSVLDNYMGTLTGGAASAMSPTEALLRAQ
jgi:hypothetical protein